MYEKGYQAKRVSKSGSLIVVISHLKGIIQLLEGMVNEDDD